MANKEHLSEKAVENAAETRNMNRKDEGKHSSPYLVPIKVTLSDVRDTWDGSMKEAFDSFFGNQQWIMTACL